MYIHLDKKSDNLILDVGCGTGLLGISSEPFLGEKGRYVGIDVMENDIKFCRNHYPPSSFEFIHFDSSNPAYAPSQKSKRLKWNLEDERFDLVTALSVWTHLNEEDALFYIKEVNRILKIGGKAIITFFLLDDLYERSLKIRSSEKGKYHFTSQNMWIFDKPAYDSEAWLCPKWAKVPESAIGVTNVGFERLITESELELIKHYPGNWKEIPGVFFQDILVFQKV
jgi:SAM-dependent methyltransferase